MYKMIIETYYSFGYHILSSYEFDDFSIDRRIEEKIDRKTASMRVVVGFPKIKVWDEAGLHVPPPLPLCYLLALVLALKLQKLS